MKEYPAIRVEIDNCPTNGQQTRQEFTDWFSSTYPGERELLDLGIIAVVPWGCGLRRCPGSVVQATDTAAAVESLRRWPGVSSFPR